MTVKSGSAYARGTLMSSVRATSNTGAVMQDTVSYSTPIAETSSWSRDSVNTPGFRRKVRPSPLPMNYFKYARLVYKRSSGTHLVFKSIVDGNVYNYVNTYAGIEGDICSDPSLLDPSEKASLDRRATNKILLKVKDQKINLAQAFHEREQTVRMITTNVVRISKALSALRKGDFVKAANALGLKLKGLRSTSFGRRFRKDQSQALAQGWLELQYGWKPLLNDIYGGAEAIATARYGSPKETSKTRTTASHSTMRKWSDSMANYVELKETTCQISYVCQYSNANEPVTRSLAQLGITNPILIAWELMPWSFVIDWFVPIGGWISTFDATQGLQFKRGCKTVFEKATTLQTTTYNGALIGTARHKGCVISSAEQIAVERTVLSTFPSVVFPPFKDPTSLLHLANAMALLRTNLPRK